VFSLGNSSDAFLILRARDLGMGAVLVVLAYAVYNVLYASLSWPFGALSDRRRRTLLIGGGLAVFALVYLGFAFAPGSWAVWPLFAVYGVYIAATEGVARAWVADHLIDRRAAGTAYGIFFLATAAAALVASIVAGLLWEYVSTRAPFLLGAGAAVVALILLLAFEAGWEAKSRTVKGFLIAGAALAALGIVVVALEHGSIASALEGQSESALPAALVRPCVPAPASPEVSTQFPRPDGAHFIGLSREGPTTVLTGWFESGVRDARDAFESGLRSSRYTVLRSELDVADSEVNFDGRGTTGQVKLMQDCRDRTKLRITIRPD
jgi:MFS family permease